MISSLVSSIIVAVVGIVNMSSCSNVWVIGLLSFHFSRSRLFVQMLWLAVGAISFPCRCFSVTVVRSGWFCSCGCYSAHAFFRVSGSLVL